MGRKTPGEPRLEGLTGLRRWDREHLSCTRVRWVRYGRSEKEGSERGCTSREYIELVTGYRVERRLRKLKVLRDNFLGHMG